MKAAKIYATLIADVKKALAYLAASKAAKAQKKLESMLTKAEEKLSKADAPKKARKPNAFALFVKANRKTVADANPNMKSTDIMKLLGKMYRGEAAKPASPKAASPKKKTPSPKKSSSPKAPAKRGRKPKAA